MENANPKSAELELNVQKTLEVAKESRPVMLQADAKAKMEHRKQDEFAR